ncbi:iron chelate uptake ABC transporter family permease subunit [uncultured Anaerobiospirillum sp.]|uniref:ABC transporter permease n=1 Tax=uncultured Anaerobiospirillum sp. TaxID=265728 RepID=UPI0028037579|nr:iron chelate uptake ABC transporter family permease subunit [uncultured Anaerobiospirillum sp.]
MSHFWKNNSLSIVLSLLILVLSIYSLFVGVLDISLIELISSPDQLEILAISRFPRLMAILLSGAGLAVAGLIMQNLCANKFVSPSTAATIQSAQLGILIAMLFLPSSTLMERAYFSFAFAMLGTWIFVSFVQRVQLKDMILVPLVGIMFGNIISGITAFIAFRFEMNQALSSFLVGHFSTVIRGHYEIVYMVAPLILLACYFARYFNIVGMGRNFSQNLGVNYSLFLLLGLSLAAMITASVVVVVGTISYIGLIVPNLVTIYKGDNLKNTITDTALAGSLFVLVCDLIGRIIIAPYELPIELISGCVGSLIFISLIFYRIHGSKSHGSFMSFIKKILSSPQANSCSSAPSCMNAANHENTGIYPHGACASQSSVLHSTVLSPGQCADKDSVTTPHTASAAAPSCTIAATNLDYRCSKPSHTISS